MEIERAAGERAGLPPFLLTDLDAVLLEALQRLVVVRARDHECLVAEARVVLQLLHERSWVLAPDEDYGRLADHDTAPIGPDVPPERHAEYLGVELERFLEVVNPNREMHQLCRLHESHRHLLPRL